MRPAVLLASLSALLTVAVAQAPPGPSFNPLAPGTATVYNGAQLLAALHANTGNISLAGASSRSVQACRELRLRRMGLQQPRSLSGTHIDGVVLPPLLCIRTAADIYLQPTDWQMYALPISIKAFNQTVLIHGGGCCTRAGMPCGWHSVLPARYDPAPCLT